MTCVFDSITFLIVQLLIRTYQFVFDIIITSTVFGIYVVIHAIDMQMTTVHFTLLFCGMTERVHNKR